MRALILACFSLATLTGCKQSPTLPNREQLLGIIVPWGQDSAQIAVRAEEDRVVVSIKTYGDGCYSKGETAIVRSGGRVEITPIDVRTGPPGAGCVDILRTFKHEVVVGFEVPRPWTLVIRGRKMPSGESISIVRLIE